MYIDILGATPQIPPDLLKAMTVLSDTTVQISTVKWVGFIQACIRKIR